MSEEHLKAAKNDAMEAEAYAAEMEEKMAEIYFRADRIEELEAKLHLMKTAGIIEVSVRNPSVMEYMKHWEGRAEAAEAKLAKVMEHFKKLRRRQDCLETFDAVVNEVVETALAELTGGRDADEI